MIRRAAGAAGIVAVALLVVTAAPADAASLALVSEHTTFGTGGGEPSPTTLTNATVSGSGESATVTALSEQGGQSFPDAGSTLSETDRSGVLIEPTEPVSEVSLSLNAQTSGATTAYIVDHSTGTTLTTAAISNGDATLTADLQQGEQYRVVVDDSGNSYTRAFNTSSTSLPKDGGLFEVDGFVVGGSVFTTVSGMSLSVVSAEARSSSARYVGAAHSASASQAFVDLELSNASATVEWQEDADSNGQWTTVSAQTVTSSTNVSTDLSGTTSDRWRVVVDVSATSEVATAEIGAEGVLADTAAPSIDNSSASPDQTAISTRDTELSIDVGDADFGAPGDELTLEWYTNGAVANTTTVSDNGTATATVTFSPGGSNTWSVRATDQYGNVVESDQFEVAVPSTLEIRNESAPSELANLGGDVEVRFYFDLEGAPEVYSRDASGGTVNLTGLPVDRPFTVTVSGADGYVDRRIFVESLYERQSVYLLPGNQTSVPVIFDVADYSGAFDQDESALQIQRALNGSWETVEGDLIGANERVSTRLRLDARHRIVIVNPTTGARRVLGPFTPVSSGEQQVAVTSNNEVRVGGLDGVATLAPDIGALAPRSTTLVGTVRAQNASVASANLTVSATDANGSTSTLTTVSSTSAGDIEASVDLAPYAGGTVSAVTTFETGDGRTRQVARSWRVRGDQFADRPSLLGVVGDVPGLLPSSSADAFTLALSILITTVTTAGAAATFRLPTEAVAMLAVLQLAAWGAVGWLPWTIPFAAGAGALGLAALRRSL